MTRGLYDLDKMDLGQLLQANTHLSTSDALIIETLGRFLPYIASLTEADVFVDALTTNEYDSIVLCWARPSKRSLYNQSVVGKLAHPFNEPAVYKTLLTGEPSFGVRGLSQENIPIAQTVVPVYNSEGQVIAVLIMERDITEQVNQEAQVELLSETAEQLSRTLMGLSINPVNFPDHLRDGVVVLDGHDKIKYANRMALKLFQFLEDPRKTHGFFHVLPEVLGRFLYTTENNRPWSQEIQVGDRFIKVEGIPLTTKEEVVGTVMILSDLTDLRQKEKELIIKSVAIQEIHHRVKNNLQNIASLLRLQMRRVDNQQLRSTFTESINRILSMSLVYDVLAKESMDEVDIKQLCERIIQMLFDTVPRDCYISTHIGGSSVLLPSSQAVTLTLVINELLSNAMKHAFQDRVEGKLEIRIFDENKDILLEIQDDGGGFPEDPLPSGHLGLQIVKLLVEEKLRGSFSILSYEGTKAAIRFPKRSVKEVVG